MFDYAMNLIKERINLLESTNQPDTEIFLGVSNITDNIRDFLDSLGWRALYVEQGIFQLVKQ